MSEATPAGLLPDIPGADQLSIILGTLSDPGFWARAGIIVLGSALIIVGLVLMIAGTRGVRDAASMAVGVATKGIVK